MTASTCEWCTEQVETPWYCPFSGAIPLLCRRDAMQLISIVCGHGTMRFGDIPDHLSPASTASLPTRPKNWLDAGLINRRQYDEIPPGVKDELSANGRVLRSRLYPVLTSATHRRGTAAT